jgi:hypothetical protein
MDPVFDKPLKDDNTIRYRGRTHSSTGRLSLGIGISGWVVFAVLILESINPPAGSDRIGIIGCLDLILGILGMLFGGRGLRDGHRGGRDERDGRRRGGPVGPGPRARDGVPSSRPSPQRVGL